MILRSIQRRNDILECDKACVVSATYSADTWLSCIVTFSTPISMTFAAVDDRTWHVFEENWGTYDLLKDILQSWLSYFLSPWTTHCIDMRMFLEIAFGFIKTHSGTDDTCGSIYAMWKECLLIQGQQDFSSWAVFFKRWKSTDTTSGWTYRRTFSVVDMWKEILVGCVKDMHLLCVAHALIWRTRSDLQLSKVFFKLMQEYLDISKITKWIFRYYNYMVLVQRTARTFSCWLKARSRLSSYSTHY